MIVNNIGFDADIAQAFGRRERRINVARRIDLASRQGEAEGEFRGLQIADFAQHDDVGIETQGAAHDFDEGFFALFILDRSRNADLARADDAAFWRIFDHEKIEPHFRFRHAAIEHDAQRRGFALVDGARKDAQAARRVTQALHDFELFLRKAERVDVRHDEIFAEQICRDRIAGAYPDSARHSTRAPIGSGY